MKLLLGARADVSRKDSAGRTCAHMALLEDAEATLPALGELLADEGDAWLLLRARDAAGCTLLMLAAGLTQQGSLGFK